MRLQSFLVVILVLLGIGISDAKDKKWREKKAKHQAKHHLLGKTKHVGDMTVNHLNHERFPGYHAGFTPKVKSHKFKHYGYGKKFHKGMFPKKDVKKVHKAMAWLNVKDCDLKCKNGEICIKGPVMAKAICVHKKDLKKSMKMFHQYRRKEMKAWKKYQKKNYKSDWKLKKEKYQKMKEEKHHEKMKSHHLDKTKHEKHEKLESHLDNMKKDHHGKMKGHHFDKMTDDMYKKLKGHHFDKMTDDDYKKMKSHHFDKMKENKEEKYGKMKENKLQKLGKDKHLKEEFHKKKHLIHVPLHKPIGPECGSSELEQMKVRMMGWFHLLHGQDHEARKAHGGSIGKFYKHVSVKKELREYNGIKCQCMKSAMWQFHQMDMNNDKHLTHTEMTMLEENNLEPCVRPYLQSCDRDGDKKISSDEWCCCFTNILPPCYKMLNEIRNSGEPVTYMPRCDKEGYFMHEQCKGKTENTRVCWCVDYNGNEFKDTVRSGRAHCSKIQKYGYKKTVPLI